MNKKHVYKVASSWLCYPASIIKQPEQADHLMASIRSMSIEDPLTKQRNLEMAYRRTITADLLPRPRTRLDERETETGFPAYTA